VGPSEDGGYDLVGMARLHCQLFRNIPWSSAQVMEETLKRSGDAGIAVSLLPLWRDVDTATDLHRPELRDEGSGAAVVIGTDSPDLPLAFIASTFARLEQGENGVVVGPSEDGGYYLVGMARLHHRLFRNIPWSSDRVMEETLKSAADAEIAVSLLPLWRDVDTETDLHRPELRDEGNGAPLTREFLLNWLKETS